MVSVFTDTSVKDSEPEGELWLNSELLLLKSGTFFWTFICLGYMGLFIFVSILTLSAFWMLSLIGLWCPVSYHCDISGKKKSHFKEGSVLDNIFSGLSSGWMGSVALEPMVP